MRYFWVFLNFNHAPSVKHRIRNERKLSFYKLEEINSGGVKLKKWNHKVGNEITLKSKDKNNHPLSSHGPCAHTHTHAAHFLVCSWERERVRESKSDAVNRRIEGRFTDAVSRSRRRSSVTASSSRLSSVIGGIWVCAAAQFLVT